MTGAPIPPGCDAVVPVEETEESGDQVTNQGRSDGQVSISASGVKTSRNGETIIAAGTLIRPPEISMLASFGKAFVPVYRKARVAILSTGDELIELGEPLATGQIINSNALSLAAAVMEIGALPVILGIARDNPESHREKMLEGLKADALITSAGVSAGDRDLVRDMLAELGVEQLFWRVDIKPGGPTAFGMKDGKPVFSLPGNPVSTMVTFEEFVRPALLKMMGHKRVIKPFIKASSAEQGAEKAGEDQLPAGEAYGGKRQISGIQFRRPEHGYTQDHAHGRRHSHAPRRPHRVLSRRGGGCAHPLRQCGDAGGIEARVTGQREDMSNLIAAANL